MPARTARGVLWLTLQPFALNVLSLFTTALIIRTLGAGDYGAWAVAATLATAHLAVTNLGLRPLFVRRVAQAPDAAAGRLAEQLAVRLCLGALACASAIGIAVALGYPPVVRACLVASLCGMLLTIVWTTIGDTLQALEDFQGYAVVALVAGLVSTAASVAAVMLGAGPVGLSWAYVCGPAASVVLLATRMARRGMPLRVGCRWTTARALLRDCRWIALHQGSSAFRDRAEQLIVPTLVGIEPFGMFNAGMIPADRLTLVPDAVSTAFYPRIARAKGNDAQRVVATLLTVALVLSLPIALVTTYVAPAVASILFPGDSAICQLVMQVTIWALPPLAASMSMTSAMQAAGHHDAAAGAGLRATLLTTLVSVVLIASLGVVGACWSYVLRPTVLAGCLLPRFVRLFPTAMPRVPLWRIAMSGAALGVICWLSQADRSHLGQALVAAAVASALYGTGLLLTRAVPFSSLAQVLAPARGANS